MSTGNATADAIYELLHITPSEWGVIGLGIAVYAVDLILLAYVDYHRNYVPLKLKQILLVNLSVISGAIWWIGTMASIRVLPQADDPVFLVCSFWTFWVEILLGFGAFVVTLFARFVRVYAALQFKVMITGWRLLLLCLTLLSPLLIFSVVTTALHADGPIPNEYNMSVCYLSDGAVFTFWTIVLLYLVAVIITVLLIGIFVKKHGVEARRSYVMKEYEQARTISIIAFVAFVVYFVTVAVNAQVYVWGRCLVTATTILMPTCTFLVEIGLPAYKCVFDHENYANEVMHGQGSEKKWSWLGCCRPSEESPAVVMSVSHVVSTEYEGGEAKH